MVKKIKVKLCSNNIWCPEVEYDGKKVVIKDDYGNRVRLSIKEWNLLVQNITDGKFSFLSSKNK